MAEFYIAFLIDRFGIFEEALVTGDIGRVELRDFAEQLLFIVGIIELRSDLPII